RPRPRGNCRQRKRRCVVEPGQTVCVLCRQLPERPSKRPRTKGQDTLSGAVTRTINEHSIRTVDVVEDYDALHGPSPLKKPRPAAAPVLHVQWSLWFMDPPVAGSLRT
ncbi:hypothetical protein BDV12DRAFT_180002, partial [Aspergillus spectabilis]